MTVNQRQHEAFEYAKKVNLILDPKFFPDAWNAVEKRDGIAFEICCIQAGITDPKLIKCMRAKLIDGEDKNSPSW